MTVSASGAPHDTSVETWREQVSRLIALIRDSDLCEVTIEQGDFALHIERDLTAAPALIAALSSPTASDEVAAASPTYLRSPQVGTFYLSSEPQGEPFIHEGGAVEQGQVIGLIEAMKLIGEVEAEEGGTVRRVLVADGQPVEYGQPLFELE